jgi:hypothetical protein
MLADEETVVGAMDGPDGEAAAQTTTLAEGETTTLAEGETTTLAEGLYLEPALFFEAVYGGPLDSPPMTGRAGKNGGSGPPVRADRRISWKICTTR